MEYEVKSKEEALIFLKGIAASIAQQEVEAAQIANQFNISPSMFEQMIKDAMQIAMFEVMQKLLMEPLLKKLEEKDDEEEEK